MYWLGSRLQIVCTVSMRMAITVLLHASCIFWRLLPCGFGYGRIRAGTRSTQKPREPNFFCLPGSHANRCVVCMRLPGCGVQPCPQVPIADAALSDRIFPSLPA